MGDLAEDDGGLRGRLLDAALERLETTPADRLSLRQLAADLGVSHQAPYVHFGSRRGFLAAAAGVGLHRAAEQAASRVEAAGDDPRARLQALADAYLAFISDHPHVHDLAYGPAVAKGDHRLLEQAAAGYWDLLRDCVRACQPPGTGEEELLRRCAVTWGSVYGIARLFAFRQIPASVPSSSPRLVEAVLATLVAGWQASAIRPCPPAPPRTRGTADGGRDAARHDTVADDTGEQRRGERGRDLA